MGDNQMRAPCPRCDGERVCDIHGHFARNWDSEHQYGLMHGGAEHRILQCRGCETVFYCKSSWSSEEFEVIADPQTGEGSLVPTIKNETYPFQKEKNYRPDWSWEIGKSDMTLSYIMDETYRAAEIGSFILASVGLRTALDRTMEVLGIDTGLSMAAKVKALFDGGWVGESERKTLDVVADAGNAAAHRGWSPDRAEFLVLLKALENFLERAVLGGRKALEVGSKIPPRARKSIENKGSAS